MSPLFLHRTQAVIVVVVHGVAVVDVDHADRLVHAGTVDVLAEELVVAVVFGDAVVAVVEVLDHGHPVIGLGDPPAAGIVGIGDLLPVDRAVTVNLRADPQRFPSTHVLKK